MPSRESTEEIVDDPVNAPVVDEAVDTSAVETAATDTEVEAPAEQPQSWYQRLGNDYAGLDESAALERVRNQLAESQRVAQENQTYQQLLYQARQAQQPAPKPVEKPKWNAPDFDPAWLDMVQRNEKGDLVAKSGADPTLPAKIAAYAKFRDDTMNRFARDPDAFLQERFEASMQDRVQTLVQQEVADYHTTMAVNNWEQQNKDILFNPRVPGMQPSYSPAGQRIVSRSKELLQMGIGDPVAALNQAMQDLHYDLLVSGALAPKQNGAAAPVPTVPQKQAQALRNAANGARRNPSRAVPSETTDAPRPRQSFKDLAKQEFETAGIGMNDKVA